MSRNDSDEVTFPDASACFSEDEWKLLHDWQKDLYRNVMKEIHQALISLGPLITNTIHSLRAKEIEELCPVDRQSERRARIKHSPRDSRTNPDMLYKIQVEDPLHLSNVEPMILNKEEPLHLNNDEPIHFNNTRDTRGKGRHDCLNTGFSFLSTDIHLRKEEEPASIFIDHLGAEMGECSTDPTSGHEVVSFRIKDEDVTSCMELQESRRMESIGSSADAGIMNRKRKGGPPEKKTGKSSPCKIPQENDKIKAFHSPEKGAHLNSQLWSEITQNLVRANTSQCESGYSDSAHFSAFPETHDLQRVEQYPNYESNTSQANLACPPDLQQSQKLYSCVICDKGFSKKENLIRHKRIHMGVRPYQCNECEKSFIRNENLIVHKRTHTGERPYQCTTCKKSFSQQGILSRHQRTHIGERPYQYTECERSFLPK